MNLSVVEMVIQWLAGLLAFSALGLALFGVWRGTQRQAGRTTGHAGGWLRSPWFYLASSAIFLWISALGWTPISIIMSPPIRTATLIIGAIIYFPGMGLLVWGRLALGREYFVSSGFGAQLFADQKLVTGGPYAIIRHPMYVGLFLAALGSLLIFTTWTTLYFVCFAPLTALRAWREDKILEEEFGDQWREYRQHVPAFIPRFWKMRELH